MAEGKDLFGFKKMRNILLIISLAFFLTGLILSPLAAVITFILYAATLAAIVLTAVIVCSLKDLAYWLVKEINFKIKDYIMERKLRFLEKLSLL